MKFPETPQRKSSDVWYGVLLAIGSIFLLPVMIFVFSVVKAFVISTLWYWYIVPFFNLPELPLAISFGIGLLFSYLIPVADQTKDKKLGEKIAYLILFPSIVLLFGWLGTFFI